MKQLIVILGLLISSNGFGQYSELTPFYWNTLSSINPANSGFNSKFSTTVQGYELGFNENSLNYSDRPYSIWANADLEIDKLHGGLGLSYNHFYNGRNRSNTLKLNYNYQIEINENHKLSFGLSLGADNVILRQPLEPFFGSSNEDMRYAHAFSFPYYSPEYNLAPSANYTRAKVGGGLIYRLKKIELGASFTNHMETGHTYNQVAVNEFDQEWNVYNVSLIHFYTNYRFNIFKGFEMNPIIAYQEQTGSGFRLMMLDLNFIIKEIVLIGGQLVASAQNADQAHLMLGVEIARKFRINYSYGVVVSRFTNQSVPGHNLVGLTYSIQ